MDEVNRGHLGARFLEEEATSIDGLALPGGIEPALTHGLTTVYAQADVEAPEALVEQLIGWSDQPAQEVQAAPADVRTANRERRGGSVRSGGR